MVAVWAWNGWSGFAFGPFLLRKGFQCISEEFHTKSTVPHGVFQMVFSKRCFLNSVFKIGVLRGSLESARGTKMLGFQFEFRLLKTFAVVLDLLSPLSSGSFGTFGPSPSKHFSTPNRKSFCPVWQTPLDPSPTPQPQKVASSSIEPSILEGRGRVNLCAGCWCSWSQA